MITPSSTFVVPPGLSIASVVVGFLTFTYAVVVGIWLYVQRARKAEACYRKYTNGYEDQKLTFCRLADALQSAKSYPEIENSEDSGDLLNQIDSAREDHVNHSRRLEKIMCETKVPSKRSLRFLRAYFSLRGEKLEKDHIEMCAAADKLEALRREIESRLAILRLLSAFLA